MRQTIALCAVLFLVVCAGIAPAHAAPTIPFDSCVAQDDGGTASLPVPACRLASPVSAPASLFLSTGDVLEARFYVDSFFDIEYSIDPGTGDETATFGALMTMELAGQGGLAGYERTLTIPLQMETLHGARNAGDPSQTFPNEMVSMQGEIFGDPDFDFLRVTAGGPAGLPPSPGQTTLTRLPRGDFNVDSFFDIEYRIEFQGAPGGALAGESGNRTYQLEIRVNRIEMAIAAPNPGGSSDVPADLPIAPPAGESLQVTEGLPTDSSFRLRPRASNVTLVSTGTGSLGGPSYQSEANVEVVVAGEGGLAGFRRTIVVPHVFDVHAAPFDPAADVQEFDTEMVQLRGEIFGDPDFDELRLTAGSAEGLPPSPGHTTLTRLPSGNFNVDSFFDIEYRIEFVGAPGGALAGASGVQTGTLRLEQGGRLPRLRLYTHGPEVEPIGAVRLDELPAPTGDGSRLRVSNLGSSGKDGVSGIDIDFGDGEPLGFEMRLDMGPAGGMPPGASCRLDLVTRDATGVGCSRCLCILLEAQADGTLGVSMDPPPAGSSRVLRVREGGGSVQLRSLSPGDGALVGTGALGTTADGPLRLRVETGDYGTGGGGGGGRIVVRAINPTPTALRLAGAATSAVGTELQISLDGLPPGEPVKGVQLRCDGLADVTVDGLEIVSPAARRGFDPDPDNNCTVGVKRPRMSSSNAPGGDGTTLPYFALSELGPLEGGLLFTSDFDRDGVNDRARVGEMWFTAGDELRLPADARLRLSAASDTCGPGSACSLGLELERPGAGEAVGRLALEGFAPQQVTLVARLDGTDVDSVVLPAPLPPELFGGELRGLLGDPMRFDIATAVGEPVCGCTNSCTCTVMHLIAPQPTPISLTGSPIGPVSADELELRVALDPNPKGVPTEMISMSLRGTQLCEAAVYSTRFDPLALDLDGDGVDGASGGGSDCDDTDSSFWAPPGEVRDVRLAPQLVRWSPPADAGGLPGLLLYDTLVSSDASDFSTGSCIESNDGDDTEAAYPSLPDVGNAEYTLTRAGNGCPSDGTLGAGAGSGGSVWIRTGPVCP